MDFTTQLDNITQEYETVQQQMADPANVSDSKKMKRLGKLEAKLRTQRDLMTRHKELEQQITEHQELAASDDSEMAELAKSELPELEKQLSTTEQKIHVSFLEEDPDDDKNVIIEIRAGAGGDEAALFAADLFGMYTRYAETQGWNVTLVSKSQNDLGGFKEVIAEINGTDVYRHLKYERGVHRIQRIPSTEKSGRIHTSTATVAVMPQVEEQEFELNTNDLRIDVFRSAGAGGQHVNTTDSAVRITHIPTGIVVSCQDERSQLKNRTKAMRVLRSRLKEHEEEQRLSKEKSERRSQIGTGDRSEKIRTYNVPQNRITDHRIKQSWHGVDLMFEGKIDTMLNDIQQAAQEQQLAKR